MRESLAARSGRSTLFGPLTKIALGLLAVAMFFDPNLSIADNQSDARRGAGGEYRLGAQDKVRVKVFAWRPSISEVYEWKALNDVYSVGATGEISFPLIGDVAVGGLTLPEVSQAISAQMKSGLGLVEAPQASVEIVEFRPFYITGGVQKPGEYAYRPGLTIIKAISLAGGMLRLNELDTLRLDRETIATAGERSVNAAELSALVARRARLEAEISGATAVAHPAGFGDATEAAVLLAGEQQIFEARLASYNSKADQYGRTTQMLEQQLDEIRRHMTRVSEQVKLSADELRRFDDMLARRLTTNTRRAEIARLAMQAEDERVRLQATETTVQRDLIKAKMDVQDLRDARIGQSIVELRAAEARIDSLARRVRTADRIVSDASAIRLASFDGSDEKPAVKFTIIRNGVEIDATETTVLQPGDTVKVANSGRVSGVSHPAAGVKDEEPAPSQGTILTQANAPQSLR